jgi:hypothetical protein
MASSPSVGVQGAVAREGGAGMCCCVPVKRSGYGYLKCAGLCLPGGLFGRTRWSRQIVGEATNLHQICS